MALGRHPSWSDAGRISGQKSGRRYRFPQHAGLALAVLLCGCAALGLDTSFRPAPRMPPTVAMSADMTGSMPEVASLSPPMSPEMASVEPPVPMVQPPAPKPRPNRQPPPKPKEEAPTPGPPKILIGDLLGSDFTAVLHVFRSPDSVNNENLSVVWTYAPPGCTLRLFFYPDIKTTVFHLLKYDFRDNSGEMQMPADACIDSILSAAFREAAPP